MLRRGVAAANRQSEAEAAAQPPRQLSGEGVAAERVNSKGRPTPSRKQALQRRKELVKPPTNRREAMARDRERARQKRAAARAGVAAGDDRYVPRRDKGPVRKYVRDYIDSRRTLSSLFMPLAVVLVLLSTTLLIAQPLLLALMLATIVELVLLSVWLRRSLRERFPELQGQRVGSHLWYGVMRATQMRKIRMPKAQVKPGDSI